ncbi:MAG: hypothetical protein M3P08_11425 [Thermoproteota archaeon]|nr:hypothetical protein [Thermoproteota archaeon]
MTNYKLPHPSPCKACEEIANTPEHGYIDYLADSKEEYIHGPTCVECDRIGQKQMAHLLRYGPIKR